MDFRKRTHRHAIAACLGTAALIFFCLAMGEAGFGKPVTDKASLLEYSQAPIGNSIGHDLKNLSEQELRDHLQREHVALDDNMSLHEMRRALLANYYRPLFDSVSLKSEIPVAVVFAYFIIEATREGIESPMFLATWNPGGVKYKGIYTPYYAYDDCKENGRPVMCAFENPGSFENSIALWSGVFNSERYRKCKGLSVQQTCKCLEVCGYHTAKNHKQRARIALKYDSYINMFERVRR